MKKSHRQYRISPAGFILALLVVVSADAATITVTSTADAGGACPGSTCTLRQAMAAAASGDTINFSLPAKSAITLTSGRLLIDKNLTISGPGANLLTVQRSNAGGTPAFRIFELDQEIIVASISGLTVANGSSGNGGGILNQGTLTLSSCTVSGNHSQSEGGGISNVAAMTISNTAIYGNSANGKGGAIFSYGTLTITNSTISGNSGTGVGGGIHMFNALTVTNCTISGNTLGGMFSDGGGIYASGGSTVKVRNTIIAGNTATSSPDFYGSLTSQGHNLIGNTSGTSITPTTGDQLNVDPKLGPLQYNGGPTFTRALLSGSTAIEGGNSSGSNTDQRGFARPVLDPSVPHFGDFDGSDIGAYEVQSDQLPGCTNVNRVVKNNNDSGPDSLRGVIANVCAGSTIAFAPGVTGAINLTSGELAINKSLTIDGPGANMLAVQRSAGAGNFRIFNIAPASVIATISGLTIANGNSPGKNGGGIYNNGGALTVSNCVLSGNSAGGGAGGGGVFNDSGTLTVANSTITGNLGGFGGGGINSFYGTVTVSGSTLSGNTVNGGNGGGIYASGDSGRGTLTVTNSTISGNSATDTTSGFGIAVGGGIHSGGGTVSVTNSTIANNSAQFRGGGVNNTITSKNAIIALNTSPSGPDVFGTLTSKGYNLIGNTSGTSITPTTGDQVNVDPKLGPLQDNGGPTFTRALLSESSAIDKGNSSGSSADQRGFPRPVGSANVSGGDGSDIGAFEFGSSPPTPTPTPTATPGLVGNVSTRLPVGADDNVLIEGFIVQGPAGSTKKIIVRAIGPSLVSFGITDALANPTLEIHDSSGATVATNNDWKITQVGGLIPSDQSAAIAASQLAPSNDLESAMIADLSPGSYTAVVRGVNNTTGTGVVDAYDLSGASPARLANIATRGLIQAGDKLMIAGFIVQNGPVRAVVRAVGPSLVAFGITNALPDTTLQLRDQNGAIVVEDDDWKIRSNGSSQQAELEATGLQPTDDREAAFVTTLQPGQYTAQVRGKPEGTGIGVVQVYFLQ